MYAPNIAAASFIPLWAFSATMEGWGVYVFFAYLHWHWAVRRRLVSTRRTEVLARAVGCTQLGKIR